jgi:hypothetical protein
MRKYPTPADVDDMRNRGFDPSVIAEQTELARRGSVLEALVKEAQEAFAGVTLGEGVGLLEANGLDDYATEEKLAAFRAQDEKQDWSAIPVELLNRYSSTLSFFDAEGMRFHLPAFLIAHMRGQYGFDLVFHLVQSTGLEETCSLLTDRQREVVRGYLRFAEEDDDHAFDREHIQRALAGYWSR